MEFVILLSVFLGLTVLFVGGYIWSNHIRGKVVYLPADEWSEEAIQRTIDHWEAQGWVWERTNDRARSIRFKRR